jgi:hypothetical protein
VLTPKPINYICSASWLRHYATKPEGRRFDS